MRHAKDLTKEPPRSPYVRIAGFALMARAIDKGRAHIAGMEGNYHFKCPVDRMFLSFARIKAKDFEEKLREGLSDHEMGEWVKETSGLSNEEIHEWSESIEGQFDDMVQDDLESFS